MPDTSELRSPDNAAGWREAFVKWTRYDHVAMYDYPTTQNSEAIMAIYKGDVLQISRRYRREDWCLCRVGHVLGWVFLQDVRFMVHGGKSPRPKTRPPQRPVPEVEEHRAVTIPNRNVFAEKYWDIDGTDTSPVTPAQPIIKPGTGELPPLEEQAPEIQAKKAKKNMLNRLINFFNK